MVPALWTCGEGGELCGVYTLVESKCDIGFIALKFSNFKHALRQFFNFVQFCIQPVRMWVNKVKFIPVILWLLQEACKREVEEEAGLTFEPTTLLCVEYGSGYYYRLTFTGHVTGKKNYNCFTLEILKKVCISRNQISKIYLEVTWHWIPEHVLDS